MQKPGSAKAPRDLAAYLRRQRRYEDQVAGSTGAPSERRVRQPAHEQTPPPDYGCVEWFIYEQRRAEG
ncbi:MAG: hypothetical protein JXB36_04130 [Gammaproteobacteria bacterium]|nr:hypothetical protein [Gammaproteobacteria bacterium]